MAGQDNYPDTQRQIRWLSTLGDRVATNASRLTIAHAVVPKGVEGEVVKEIYGREKALIDKVQRELPDILHGSGFNLMNFFDIRDYAKGANTELGARFAEVSVPYEDFSYFDTSSGNAPVRFIQRAVHKARQLIS